MLPIHITEKDVGRTCITRNWDLVKITGFNYRGECDEYPVESEDNRLTVDGEHLFRLESGRDLMCFAPAIEGDTLKTPVENADLVMLGMLIGTMTYGDLVNRQQASIKLLSLLDIA